MGQICTKEIGDQRTLAIDKAMHRSHTEEDQVVKLLFLGSPEAGKSTMLKQCRAVFDDGFSADERRRFSGLIKQFVVSNAVCVIRLAAELQMDFTDEHARKLCEQIVPREHELPTAQTLEAIETILRDKNIILVLSRYRRELQVSDSAEYFFSNIRRIKDANYVPSDEDIIRCRVPTTRVQEIQFDLDDIKVRLVDVVGQRGEKRKWLSCFTDVTAILYVVAASEFDQYFAEDPSINRLQDSFSQFEELCSLSALAATPIMIFFNKMDILEEKLHKLSRSGEPPLTTYPVFEQFTGDEQSLTEVQNYLASKMLALNQTERPIFKHFTCAVDQLEMKGLFETVREIILDELCGPEVI